MTLLWGIIFWLASLPCSLKLGTRGVEQNAPRDNQ